MRAYLIGILASLAPLVAASGASYLVAPARSPSELAWLVLLVLVMPAAGSALAIQVFQALRPRRLFDPRGHRPELALALGAISGGLCFALAALWRAFLPGAFSDAMLLPCAGTLATAMTILPAGRVRRGRCVSCNTRLERLDLCHECGAPAILMPRH